MRRLLWVVAGVMLALSVGMAGAYFTGRAEVPDNVIRAGSVAISAEPTSAAISMDALAPGVPQSRPLTVVNNSNLPVDVVVTCAKKAGITDFYEALTCRVSCDGTVLYDGSMAALRTAPLNLVPGQRVDLQVTVAMPADAGNTLAGDYVKLSLYVDAEQSH